MNRKIYNILLNWKNDNCLKPMIVLGARQVGKTYIINEFCEKEFVNYKMINLLKNKEVVELYKLNINSEEKYNRLKLIIDFDLEKDNSILFIDEIQESEELISDLKFFCEDHNNINIICAGSLLGVKLKRSNSSFPVGKVFLEQMYPMDFEEFLLANKFENLIEEIKKSFDKNISITSVIHEKCMNLYRIYNVCGGMPESVTNMIENELSVFNYNSKILDNIIESYLSDMSKYVINKNESVKIENLYLSIPSQLANENPKFIFSSIKKGAKKNEFESAIDWLLASNIIMKSTFVKKAEAPIKGYEDLETFKLFISDIGILNRLLKTNYSSIINDELSIFKGVLAECYVATQLHYNNVSLHYWKSKFDAEIDFLLDNDDGVIPVEVKSGDNTQAKSLKIYINEYEPNYSIKISAKDFGFNKNTKIKSVPLYAVFLIK